MKTCVIIAVTGVVGLSRVKFPGEKACCLSSKTREKNVCRGRMIGLSTEMARVAEVDRGNFVWWNGKVTGSYRKYLNHAHAQSFDRCEPLVGSDVLSMRREFGLCSQPIRFVKHDSEHEHNDGESVNCGLPVLAFPRSRDSWCWPKGAQPLETRMEHRMITGQLTRPPIGEFQSLVGVILTTMQPYTLQGFMWLCVC